jgi:hypothetical protein
VGTGFTEATRPELLGRLRPAPPGTFSRGQAASIRLDPYCQSSVWGGLPDAAHSRVVLAGVALDPLAELWVFVFTNKGAPARSRRSTPTYRTG